MILSRKLAPAVSRVWEYVFLPLWFEQLHDMSACRPFSLNVVFSTKHQLMLLYSTLVTGTKNFRCCCAEVASLWLQNTRDQAELEDNQETITHTKVGHFSHSKLGLCVDPCWYHLGTLGSLHQTFPDCGNHMESLQESLARILEEKSRLEKEKEALEAAEEVDHCCSGRNTP